MRVYQPLDETEERYWICVAVLRSNGTAALYEYIYHIGNDTVPFMHELYEPPTAYEPFIDLDLVDGANDCRVVYLGEDVSICNTFEIFNHSTEYFFTFGVNKTKMSDPN